METIGGGNKDEKNNLDNGTNNITSFCMGDQYP